jgi:hypothetical protein
VNQAKFPLGWDEDRVRRVIKHYEEQSEEEATAEDEAAFENGDQTFIEVPNDLVPEIRSLLAKHQARA